MNLFMFYSYIISLFVSFGMVGSTNSRRCPAFANAKPSRDHTGLHRSISTLCALIFKPSKGFTNGQFSTRPTSCPGHLHHHLLVPQTGFKVPQLTRTARRWGTGWHRWSLPGLENAEDIWHWVRINRAWEPPLSARSKFGLHGIAAWRDAFAYANMSWMELHECMAVSYAGTQLVGCSNNGMHLSVSQFQVSAVTSDFHVAQAMQWMRTTYLLNWISLRTKSKRQKRRWSEQLHSRRPSSTSEHHVTVYVTVASPVFIFFFSTDLSLVFIFLVGAWQISGGLDLPVACFSVQSRFWASRNIPVGHSRDYHFQLPELSELQLVPSCVFLCLLVPSAFAPVHLRFYLDCSHLTLGKNC